MYFHHLPLSETLDDRAAWVLGESQGFYIPALDTQLSRPAPYTPGKAGERLNSIRQKV